MDSNREPAWPRAVVLASGALIILVGIALIGNQVAGNPGAPPPYFGLTVLVVGALLEIAGFLGPYFWSQRPPD